MDYRKIYKSFIDSRIDRNLSGYYEKHHIIPSSLGGGDEQSNIIKLKAREHFFAHMLLARIHGGPMWAALSFMSRGNTNGSKTYSCTSRQYEHIKTKDAEWKSQIYKGEKNPFYGKKHDLKTRKIMSKPRKNTKNLYGRNCKNVGDIISFVLTYDPFPIDYNFEVRDRINTQLIEKSDELKKINKFYAMSQGLKEALKDKDLTGKNNPNYGNGKAIAGSKNPMYGKQHKQSTKNKISEKSKRTLVCPHCGKVSNIANAHRWHFDNCKRK